MKISDFLLGMILPTAEIAEKEALDPILDDLFASNPDDYKAGIAAVKALENHFLPALSKSSSTVLKGLLGALVDEVNENAAKHGVS